MFQAGDCVMYAESGLCLVERVGIPDFQTFDPPKEYYFLKSAEDNSRIYVPVDTPMPVRFPISREEAEKLLQSLPALPACPPLCRDRKGILAHYQKLCAPQTCEALAQTIKSIYSRHRTAPVHLSSVEEGILKKTEHRLFSELSYALNQDEESVREAFMNRLFIEDEV